MNKQLIIKNATKNTVLASNAKTANGFFARLKGLLGRKAISPEEALVIPHCKSIHTLFMKFPIDVIFIDKNFRIVKTMRNLRPGRISTCLTKATMVIELPAGRINQTNTETEDVLYID